MIGVMFFAGLRLTGPYMQESAELWFDELNFMDVQLYSTMGFDDDDISAISTTDGVRQIAPGYHANMLVKNASQEMSVQLLSLDAPLDEPHPSSSASPLNQPYLLDGRLPKQANECLAEEHWMHESGSELGSTVRFYSGTSDPYGSTLAYDVFTIVGVACTPQLASPERGSSTIGSGYNRFFFLLLPEAFTLEFYTTVYVQADLSDAQKGETGSGSRFDQAYLDAVAPTVAALEATASKRSKLRFDSIVSDAEAELADARAEIAQGYLDLAEAEQKLNEVLELIEAGWLELQSFGEDLEAFRVEEADARAELSQAEDDVFQAEQDLLDLEPPTWYVLDLESNSGFRSYKEQIGQMESIAVMIPVLFFLIAALVSMTSITRLVDSDRTIIGTFKALGYTNRTITARYLGYAFSASLLGGVLGIIVGSAVFPPLIFNAFRTMYSIAPGPMVFSWFYLVLSIGIALLCTVGPALLVCLGILRETPASAMRPLAPPPGKRILLEYIKPLWRRLSFLHKITARNLLRYKKRAFMTILGVAGCTALMFTGFALNDSLVTIGPKQYRELHAYDITVAFKSALDDNDLEELFGFIDKSPEVSSSTLIRRETVDILSDVVTKDLAIIVSLDPAELQEYFLLRPRAEGLFSEAQHHQLNNAGIIMTEQIARQLGVDVGDILTFRNLDDEEAEFTVGGISENYVYHYVFMTAAVYEAGFGKDYEPNQILGVLTSGSGNEGSIENESMADGEDLAESEGLAESLMALSAVSGVSFSKKLADDFASISDVLEFVMVILILSAAALLFVVLFSLNTINREERTRELASIKVLGFQSRELASYVYREGLILTVIGIAFGLLLGVGLERYIITTIEIDVFMFSRDILLPSYVYSVLLTALFALVVNLVLYRPLTRIDMVSSLKAIE